MATKRHKPVFFDGGGMAMKSQKSQKKDDWTGDGWITLRTVTRGPEYLQDVRSSSLGIMRKARKRDRVEEECLGSVITITDRNLKVPQQVATTGSAPCMYV